MAEISLEELEELKRSWEGLEDKCLCHLFADRLCELVKLAIKGKMYEGVLEKISDPIGKIKKELKEGERMDGFYAIQLLNNPAYLRSLAKEALEKGEG